MKVDLPLNKLRMNFFPILFHNKICAFIEVITGKHKFISPGILIYCICLAITHCILLYIMLCSAINPDRSTNLCDKHWLSHIHELVDISFIAIVAISC